VVTAAMAAALAASTAGCTTSVGPSLPTFNSRADLANTAPVARLLIFADVYDRDLGPNVSQGLIAGLTNRLTACGVPSAIVRPDPMELDPAQRIAAVERDFQPSAVLWLKPASVTTTRYSDGAARDVVLDLTVTEVATNHLDWLAKAKLHVGSNTAVFGSSFATEVVSQLRADQVLTHCPSEDAGWPRPDPGCQIDRRKALLEAQRITDQYARMQAYKLVPSCE
jgi:hypothetical protein